MSGTKTFALRLDEVVYERIRKIAEKDAVSMNTWMGQVLAEATPRDQNDLFDAAVTLLGPKHPMAIGLCDPVENVAESINETLRFLLEETDRLNYWTSFNREQIELLVSLQRQIDKPRNAYLAATARASLIGERKEGANTSVEMGVVLNETKMDSLRALDNLSGPLNDVFKGFEVVSRRRNKELANTLSDSRTLIERVMWDFNSIKGKIDKNVQKI